MEIVVRTSALRLDRGKRTVLAGADWSLRRGDRWALWGPNGSGKSTLLEALAGSRSATDGTVRQAPGVRVALVAQEPWLPNVATLDDLARVGLASLRTAERALREEEHRLADGEGDLDRYAELQEAFDLAGGYHAEPRLRRELDALLPSRSPSDRLAALSSGERRRAALALALAERPDLLLLDEPSNGLDLGMRDWLVARLRALPAEMALVVASHDRNLLGRVANASARLANGRLDPKRRTFDADRAERGVVARSAAARRRRAMSEAARLASAAEEARRHGSPARAAAARALDRRASAEAAAAKALAGQALSGQAPDSYPEDGDGRPVASLAARRELRGPLLRARGLSRRGLFGDLALDVEAGAKIVILGANGSGKSTLLSLLAAEQRSDRADAKVWLRPGARLMHWDADSRGLTHEPLANQLGRWVPDARIDSLAALVGLTRDSSRARPSELSGGERARAALALLLAAEPDLVLLDEPESDLDLPAIELLEQALVDARTTVVLATHDLRLADAVAEDLRSLDDGRLVAWRGGVDGWRHRRARREEEVSGVDLDLISSGARATEPGDPGETNPETLEDEQAAIEALLEDPTRLTVRQRERLASRRDRLITARMEAYDATLPPPLPRFRVIEPPLVLYGDRSGDTLEFHAEQWPSLPTLRRRGPIAHLVLPDPIGACWSPWARTAALRACLALAFPLLDLDLVQTRAALGPSPEPFEALDDSLWVARRPAWERFAGFVRSSDGCG